MLVARAGVIGTYSKRRKGTGKNYLELYSENLPQDNSDSLQFTKVPVALWFSGILFTIFGIYLIYHIAFAEQARLFDGFREGTWWQYMIASLTILFGLSVITVGKKEEVVFSKKEDKIKIVKTNFCCAQKQKYRRLSKLMSIKIIKKGIDSVHNNTVHFKLSLLFDMDKSIDILSTTNKVKAKKRYIEIMNYMKWKINFDSISIDDQTTKVHPDDETNFRSRV